MTHNQINYQELVELKRHNSVTETETNRNNVATLAETVRNNQAYVAESSRHNQTVESETNRHNVVTEQVAINQNSITQAHYQNQDVIGYMNANTNASKVAEDTRHNKVSEAISSFQATTDRAYKTSTAASSAKTAQANKDNAVTNLKNAGTNAWAAQEANKIAQTKVKSDVKLNTSKEVLNYINAIGKGLDVVGQISKLGANLTSSIYGVE